MDWLIQTDRWLHKNGLVDTTRSSQKDSHLIIQSRAPPNLEKASVEEEAINQST